MAGFQYILRVRPTEFAGGLGLIIRGPPAGFFHKYLSSVYYVSGTTHFPPMNRSDPHFPHCSKFLLSNPGYRAQWKEIDSLSIFLQGTCLVS